MEYIPALHIPSDKRAAPNAKTEIKTVSVCLSLCVSLILKTIKLNMALEDRELNVVRKKIRVII